MSDSTSKFNFSSCCSASTVETSIAVHSSADLTVKLLAQLTSAVESLDRSHKPLVDVIVDILTHGAPSVVSVELLLNTVPWRASKDSNVENPAHIWRTALEISAEKGALLQTFVQLALAGGCICDCILQIYEASFFQYGRPYAPVATMCDPVTIAEILDVLEPLQGKRIVTPIGELLRPGKNHEYIWLDHFLNTDYLDAKDLPEEKTSLAGATAPFHVPPPALVASKKSRSSSPPSSSGGGNSGSGFWGWLGGLFGSADQNTRVPSSSGRDTYDSHGGLPNSETLSLREDGSRLKFDSSFIAVLHHKHLCGVPLAHLLRQYAMTFLSPLGLPTDHPSSVPDFIAQCHVFLVSEMKHHADSLAHRKVAPPFVCTRTNTLLNNPYCLPPSDEVMAIFRHWDREKAVFKLRPSRDLAFGSILSGVHMSPTRSLSSLGLSLPQTLRIPDDPKTVANTTSPSPSAGDPTANAGTTAASGNAFATSASSGTGVSSKVPPPLYLLHPQIPAVAGAMLHFLLRMKISLVPPRLYRVMLNAGRLSHWDAILAQEKVENCPESSEKTHRKGRFVEEEEENALETLQRVLAKKRKERFGLGTLTADTLDYDSPPAATNKRAQAPSRPPTHAQSPVQRPNAGVGSGSSGSTASRDRSREATPLLQALRAFFHYLLPLESKATLSAVLTAWAAPIRVVREWEERERIRKRQEKRAEEVRRQSLNPQAYYPTQFAPNVEILPPKGALKFQDDPFGSHSYSSTGVSGGKASLSPPSPLLTQLALELAKPLVLAIARTHAPSAIQRQDGKLVPANYLQLPKTLQCTPHSGNLNTSQNSGLTLGPGSIGSSSHRQPMDALSFPVHQENPMLQDANTSASAASHPYPSHSLPAPDADRKITSAGYFNLGGAPAAGASSSSSVPLLGALDSAGAPASSPSSPPLPRLSPVPHVPHSPPAPGTGNRCAFPIVGEVVAPVHALGRTLLSFPKQIDPAVEDTAHRDAMEMLTSRAQKENKAAVYSSSTTHSGSNPVGHSQQSLHPEGTRAGWLAPPQSVVLPPAAEEAKLLTNCIVALLLHWDWISEDWHKEEFGVSGLVEAVTESVDQCIQFYEHAYSKHHPSLRLRRTESGASLLTLPRPIAGLKSPTSGTQGTLGSLGQYSQGSLPPLHPPTPHSVHSVGSVGHSGSASHLPGVPHTSGTYTMHGSAILWPKTPSRASPDASHPVAQSVSRPIVPAHAVQDLYMLWNISIPIFRVVATLNSACGWMDDIAPEDFAITHPAWKVWNFQPYSTLAVTGSQFYAGEPQRKSILLPSPSAHGSALAHAGGRGSSIITAHTSHTSQTFFSHGSSEQVLAPPDTSPLVTRSLQNLCFTHNDLVKELLLYYEESIGVGIGVGSGTTPDFSPSTGALTPGGGRLTRSNRGLAGSTAPTLATLAISRGIAEHEEFHTSSVLYPLGYVVSLLASSFVRRIHMDMLSTLDKQETNQDIELFPFLLKALWDLDEETLYEQTKQDHHPPVTTGLFSPGIASAIPDTNASRIAPPLQIPEDPVHAVDESVVEARQRVTRYSSVLYKARGVASASPHLWRLLSLSYLYRKLDQIATGEGNPNVTTNSTASATSSASISASISAPNTRASGGVLPRYASPGSASAGAGVHTGRGAASGYTNTSHFSGSQGDEDSEIDNEPKPLQPTHSGVLVDLVCTLLLMFDHRVREAAVIFRSSGQGHSFLPAKSTTAVVPSPLTISTLIEDVISELFRSILPYIARKATLRWQQHMKAHPYLTFPRDVRDPHHAHLHPTDPFSTIVSADANANGSTIMYDSMFFSVPKVVYVAEALHAWKKGECELYLRHATDPFVSTVPPKDFVVRLPPQSIRPIPREQLEANVQLYEGLTLEGDIDVQEPNYEAPSREDLATGGDPDAPGNLSRIRAPRSAPALELAPIKSGATPAPNAAAQAAAANGSTVTPRDVSTDGTGATASPASEKGATAQGGPATSSEVGLLSRPLGSTTRTLTHKSSFTTSGRILTSPESYDLSVLGPKSALPSSLLSSISPPPNALPSSSVTVNASPSSAQELYANQQRNASTSPPSPSSATASTDANAAATASGPSADKASGEPGTHSDTRSSTPSRNQMPLPPTLSLSELPRVRFAQKYFVTQSFLTPRQFALLEHALPESNQCHAWTRLFSLREHGASLDTLLRRAQNQSPTLLVIRDAKGAVFGAFTPESWVPNRPVNSFFGYGDSFVFTFDARNPSWSNVDERQRFFRFGKHRPDHTASAPSATSFASPDSASDSASLLSIKSAPVTATTSLLASSSAVSAPSTIPASASSSDSLDVTEVAGMDDSNEQQLPSISTASEPSDSITSPANDTGSIEGEDLAAERPSITVPANPLPIPQQVAPPQPRYSALKLEGERLNVYYWTRENAYIQLLTSTANKRQSRIRGDGPAADLTGGFPVGGIGVGGGKHSYFALHLDETLDKGSTGPCETFASPPLCSLVSGEFTLTTPARTMTSSGFTPRRGSVDVTRHTPTMVSRHRASIVEGKEAAAMHMSPLNFDDIPQLVALRAQRIQAVQASAASSTGGSTGSANAGASSGGALATAGSAFGSNETKNRRRSVGEVHDSSAVEAIDKMAEENVSKDLHFRAVDVELWGFQIAY